MDSGGSFIIYWGIAKLVRHQTLTLARPCRSLVRVQLPQPPAASVDIPGWITTKLVENKLVTIQSLYPFFAIVNGEFRVAYTAHSYSGNTPDFQSGHRRFESGMRLQPGGFLDFPTQLLSEPKKGFQ